MVRTIRGRSSKLLAVKTPPPVTSVKDFRLWGPRRSAGPIKSSVEPEMGKREGGDAEGPPGPEDRLGFSSGTEKMFDSSKDGPAMTAKTGRSASSRSDLVSRRLYRLWLSPPSEITIIARRLFP